MVVHKIVALALEDPHAQGIILGQLQAEEASCARNKEEVLKRIRKRQQQEQQQQQQEQEQEQEQQQEQEQEQRQRQPKGRPWSSAVLWCGGRQHVVGSQPPLQP